LRSLFALAAVVLACPAFAADPEYRTVKLEIDIAKPAREAWAKVGGYCDISKWLPQLDCVMTSGNGNDLGSVRALAKGRVLEILIGKTDLSYGYTQPAKPGEFYNLYHGFMEAKPVTDKTSKIVYTLVWDVSDKPDAAAKDKDVASRKAIFENALKNIKKVAEE
jgi:hypothetical protein